MHAVDLFPESARSPRPLSLQMNAFSFLCTHTDGNAAHVRSKPLSESFTSPHSYAADRHFTPSRKNLCTAQRVFRSDAVLSQRWKHTIQSACVSMSVVDNSREKITDAHGSFHHHKLCIGESFKGVAETPLSTLCNEDWYLSFLRVNTQKLHLLNWRAHPLLALELYYSLCGQIEFSLLGLLLH